MIALDANGADNGPEVVARGAELSGLDVEDLRPADARHRATTRSPRWRSARSRTPRSSRPRARSATDSADALVSPGPTGATLAAAVLHVKRIRGVHRPAVAALVPVPGGKPTLMLDVGANVEVRPEHLVQFAYMGATFMEAVVRRGAPAGRPAVDRRGGEEGHRRTSSRRTSACAERIARLRRQHRGQRRARAAWSTWSSPTASPATSR